MDPPIRATRIERVAALAASKTVCAQIERVIMLWVALLFVSEATAATGGFLPTGSMSVARFRHAATLLPDGSVLVVGGLSPCCPTLYLSSAERYDPLTGSFSMTGSMSSKREWPTATLLNNGKVLVIGGHNGATVNASAEVYDAPTGTFSPTGSLSTPRSGHTATLLQDGTVLIAGGYFNGASAEVYNPATGTFSPVANMTTPRYFHAATLLRNGKVLITGGDAAQTTAELFDPVSGTFTPTGSMSTPRLFHAETLLSNGTVLVTGIDNLNPPPPGSPSAEIYDPSNGTFSPTGDMGIPRYRHRATLLPAGMVLITGGATAAAISAELYDPVTGKFNSSGVVGGGLLDPAAPFNDTTATLLQNGQVLICGGEGWVPNDSILAMAELWSPSITSPPSIFAIGPQSGVQNGPAFTLGIGGSDFQNSATVLWDGFPRPTAFVNNWGMTTEITAADVASTAEFFSTATITVANPDGKVSNPATFTIWNPNVLGATTVSVDAVSFQQYYADGWSPNENVLYAIYGGISDQGSNPLTLTAAIYASNPTPRALPDIGAGYYALRIPGATESDSAGAFVAFPGYPLAIRGIDPYTLTLLYFNGSSWAPVLRARAKINYDFREE